MKQISSKFHIKINFRNKTSMASKEASAPCAFDKLFAKNVPHIMDKIFFSLDFVSFKVSSEVSKSWNTLLKSESIQRKAKLIYTEDMSLYEGKLIQFSGEGNAKEVRRLLSSGVNPNCVDDSRAYASYGETPLHRAADRGNNEVVKILLEGGADPDATDSLAKTPLHKAIRSNNKGAVKLLLDAGASPDPDGNTMTPLYWAAREGKTELVKMLLDGGASPNLARWWPDSPLHQAAKRGYKEVVKLLLEAGPNLNLIDSNGETPLHFAASEGNKDIVRMLLDAGADINPATLRGETPIQVAAFNFHLDVVKILFDNGARLNNEGNAHIMQLMKWANEDR